jgi:peroxiredoxin Q/BCP
LSLRALRGRPVTLFFYPADWSPVRNDELAVFDELLPEFEWHDARLVGISNDGVCRHTAFADAGNRRFASLSEFAPKVLHHQRLVSDAATRWR